MNVNPIFRKQPQTTSEKPVIGFFPNLFYTKFSRTKTPCSKFDPSVFGFFRKRRLLNSFFCRIFFLVQICLNLSAILQGTEIPDRGAKYVEYIFYFYDIFTFLFPDQGYDPGSVYR
ncbi:hypothetical protein LEP1GSC050_2661 [Leptospira broomii serovar Hurstbridge str. 5399]|uniref:Uncharacterized protein n=1 Tax=Leptospira broomii serovar Hurstbridge str. 5399 TaxID=1049789 RepID=T0F0F8_9LEPT|nr:hypothetical protein LEP1GSC050_2661 [Leptospira broomii serovar Hurstbridge str. 5399]